MTVTVLAEGWVLTRLNELAVLINGDRGDAYPSKSSFVNDGIPFINAGHLDGSAVSLKGMNYISPESFGRLRAGKTELGDVLFCLRGSLGKVGIIDDIPAGAIASSLVIVRAKPTTSPKYLFYFLKSRLAHKEIRKYNNGSAQPNLSSRSLSEFEVPLAPLDEQKRITGKLDTLSIRVNAINVRLSGVASLLERLRQSVLAAAASGKLTDEWRAGHTNTLSGDWIKTNIGAVISDLRYGTAKKCEAGADGTAVLRIPNVGDDGCPKLDDLKFASFDESEIAKLSLKKGDLLFIRSNGSVDLVGKACVIDEQAIGMLFAGYLMRIRPDPKQINSRYLWIALSSPAIRQAIEASARSTSGVNNINSEELRALPLQLPGLPEQVEIVRRVKLLLAYVDRLTTRLQVAQAATQRLTPSLLAKAFRGELVPQNPDEEPAIDLIRRVLESNSGTQAPGRKTRRPIA